MRSSRIVLAAGGIVAGLVLAAAVSATANRLEVNPQAIRAVFSGAGHMLTFRGSEGAQIVCPATLEGSFHSRTIAKLERQLIGYITRATTEKPSCTGNGGAPASEVMLWLSGSPEEGGNTLPWHVRYEAFEGTLPTITGVKVSATGVAFRLTINPLGVAIRCLYINTAETRLFGILRLNTLNGVVSSLRFEEAQLIPLNGMTAGCPERASVGGITNTVVRLGETGSVVFKLVQ